MTAPLHIMVVDDEQGIRNFIETTLVKNAYKVTSLDKAKEAIKLCAASPPDLMVLDLGLPDMDGKEVIRSLREWTSFPIIVLSARDAESEKVSALEMDADDYLAKPFGTAELLARIKVALRHAHRREVSQDNVYVFQGLHIDFTRRELSLDNKQLKLTPTEYDLLSLLARKSGQVVTQTELLREVWGKNAQENDHYLRIYVQRLRQKIGDDPLYPKYIFTEPGVGYRLADEDHK